MASVGRSPSSQTSPIKPTFSPLVRREFWGSLFIGLGAFLVYLNTLCPTIFWLDSGELVAAAYQLGIPHPPGFPLWCLLAKPFTWIPIGDIAYRVNLSSAFFAACGAVILYQLLRETGASVWAALVASFVGAFSYSYWRQAVVVEVYGLAFALHLLTLLFTLRFLRTSEHRWFLLAFLTTALGLAVHYVLLLALPVIFAALLLGHRDKCKNVPLLFSGVLCFLGGLSIFLYLPIRSLTDPVLDWGDPETLPRFLDHVRRAQYQFIGEGIGQFSLPGYLSFSGWNEFTERALTQIKSFAQLFFLREYTPGLGPIGLLGGVILWRRERHVFWITFGLILACGYGFGFVTDFSLSDVSRDHMPFLPGLLVFLVWIASGLDGIFASVRERFVWIRGRVLSFVMVFTGFCIVGLFAAGQYGECDLSRHDYARQYGEEILESIEPEGLFFAANDDAYFITLYLTAVEGLRPDISLVATSRLNQNVYPEQIQARDLRIRFPDKEKTRRLYEKYSIQGHPEIRRKAFNVAYGRAIARENFGSRPVYWDLGAYWNLENKNLGSEFALLPRGYIYELRPQGSVAPAERNRAEQEARSFWSGLERGLFQDVHFLKETSARRSAALRYNNNGLRLADAGLFDLAVHEYKMAISLAPDFSRSYFNLGTYYLRQDEDEQAAKYFGLTIRYQDDFADAHLNQGNISLKRGEMAAAERSYRNAIQADPTLITAYSNLATVYTRVGKIDPAIRMYKKALRMDPSQILVHYNLGLTLQQAGRLEQAAMSYQYAVSQMPRFVPAYVRLGQVQAETGHPRKAIQAWKQALLLDPSLDEVRKHMHALMKKTGDAS